MPPPSNGRWFVLTFAKAVCPEIYRGRGERRSHCPGCAATARNHKTRLHPGPEAAPQTGVACVPAPQICPANRASPLKLASAFRCNAPYGPGSSAAVAMALFGRRQRRPEMRAEIDRAGNDEPTLRALFGWHAPLPPLRQPLLAQARQRRS